MILSYLSTEEKRSVFDSLTESLGIYTDWYDINKLAKLTTFVLRTRTLYDANFVLVDLTDTDFEHEDVLSAATQLRKLSAARLIFIGTDNESTDILFGSLAAAGIRNLIKQKPGQDVCANLKICLTGDGMNFIQSIAQRVDGMVAAARENVRPQLQIPPGFSLKLGVCGTMNRAGTTTQCFALYHYLKYAGFIPCIVDRSQQLIQLLMALYGQEMQNMGAYFEIDGVRLAHDQLIDVDGINAFIFDTGVFSPDAQLQLEDCHLSVVMGGAKPWELSALANVITKWETSPPLYFLVSTTPQERSNLEDIFPDCFFFCPPYHPDIWRADNLDFYTKVLLERLKEVCEHG